MLRFSQSKILVLRWFRAEDHFPDFVESEPFDVKRAARDLVEKLEDESSVAFLEALISESKKAINRHAQWVIENGADIPREEWPDWWTKYSEEGI